MNDSIDKLTKTLGLELLEIVEDRRGSFLLKVRDGNKTLRALKGYHSDVQDVYDRREILLHEIEILKNLGSVVGGQYVAHGEDSVSNTWLMLRWINGESASAVGENLRILETEQRVNAFQKCFSTIAKAYSSIHDAGFLHGDVQPGHIMFEEGTGHVVVLDWGLARRMNFPNPLFKGSFVHYAAPEVARGMLNKESSIPYVLDSEIYSLGATLYFIFTGETPVNYESRELANVPFEEKLNAVAQNHLRGFMQSDNPKEVELQRIIMQCLSLDPKSRPSSVAELLRSFERLH